MLIELRCTLWAWTGDDEAVIQLQCCSTYSVTTARRIWWPSTVRVQSETVKLLTFGARRIRRRSRRNRNFTESVVAALGRYRKYTESAAIDTFGAETELFICSAVRTTYVYVLPVLTVVVWMCAVMSAPPPYTEIAGDDPTKYPQGYQAPYQAYPIDPQQYQQQPVAAQPSVYRNLLVLLVSPA